MHGKAEAFGIGSKDVRDSGIKSHAFGQKVNSQDK